MALEKGRRNRERGILTPPRSVGQQRRGGMAKWPFVVSEGFPHEMRYHQWMVEYCGYYEVKSVHLRSLKGVVENRLREGCGKKRYL